MITKLSGTGKVDPETPTDLVICKGISQTCCSRKDFQTLKNNYNGPSESAGEVAVFERYTRKSKQAMDALAKAVKLFPTVISKSKALLGKESKAAPLDAQCKSSATSLVAIDVSVLVKKFADAAPRCWKSFDNIRRGLYCNFCNNKSQTNFSTPKDSIYFQTAACFGIVKDCYSTLDIMINSIYPIFVNMEVMSRCGINGKISEVKAVVKNRLTENLGSSLTDCKNKDYNNENCTTVCSTIYTFGEENYFLQGDSDFFLTAMSNFKDNYDIPTELLVFSTEEKTDIAATNKRAKNK